MAFIEYPYLTEQEIEAERPVLHAGVYPFEVAAVEDKISKTGNPMLVLTLKVYDSEGRIFNVLDWIVLTKKMIYKLKHFAESVEKPSLYNENSRLNTEEFLNAAGYVKTKVEKNDNGIYQARIVDYMTHDAAGKETTVKKESESFEDEIKF